MTVVGILLAAGKGRRFDPTGERNKLLQPWPGTGTVVAGSAAAMLAVLPRVVAVVGPEGEGVAAELRALGCQVTECAAAADGMGVSLAHAVKVAADDADGWLIALADMPEVQSSTIKALAEAIKQGSDIAIPVMQGRRGNPVAFSRLHLAGLLALHGDQGARNIVRSHPVLEVEVSDPGIFQDIDTAADLSVQRVSG
ncbi:nucleotidyltransferase family protein [Massilia soli]|uniref:Nucleotidyltransferase family protein n=1 Tax=Massilia soli TaxID=2792854 RepID=A0ABS7SK81_9BURK|nr:nucleotidyltransferase family protein [Massilia soli]MBZ2205653.1 nucleotidyltransferase family protein [Massilia soli]